MNRRGPGQDEAGCLGIRETSKTSHGGAAGSLQFKGGPPRDEERSIGRGLMQADATIRREGQEVHEKPAPGSAVSALRKDLGEFYAIGTSNQQRRDEVQHSGGAQAVAPRERMTPLAA